MGYYQKARKLGLTPSEPTANMINNMFDQIKQDAVDDFIKRCNDACK